MATRVRRRNGAGAARGGGGGCDWAESRCSTVVMANCWRQADLLRTGGAGGNTRVGITGEEGATVKMPTGIQGKAKGKTDSMVMPILLDFFFCIFLILPIHSDLNKLLELLLVKFNPKK